VGIKFRRERQEKKEMTDYQENLLKDFIEYETIRGFKSIRKIKYLMKVFFHYVDTNDIEFKRLNHREAQNYQTYLSTLTNPDGSIHYSVRMIQDLINIVSNFYNYLKYIGSVYVNPFKSIKLLKSEKRLPANIPTEEILNEFLTNLKCFWKEKNVRTQRFKYRNHVISELMYSTGLRISELAGLEENDIDFDRGIVRVRNGKGGKERSCYLNEYSGNVLKIYITQMRDLIVHKKSSSGLFGSNSGRILEGRLNDKLNDLGKKFNIGNFTSHKFRHCIGFHLLRRGCDMRYIQLILGHDDLKSTSIYAKVDKNDLKNELDKYHPRRFGKVDYGKV
jgi:site-specific recombinase XerD